MKTVLLATDLTASSTRSLDWARLLARQYGASLALVHIHLLPTPPISGAPLGVVDTVSTVEMAADLEAISREGLDTLANQLRSEGFSVQSDWRVGPIGDEIVAAAGQLNADLIVTGRSDMNSFFDRLMGTSATSVVSGASCPVLVVPTSADSAPAQLKTIAFASQLEANDTDSFRAALALAQEFGASLQLLTVDADNQPNLYNDRDALAELNEVANGAPYSSHKIKASTVTDGLNEYLDQHPTDLLVMTSRERGFLDGLLNPSQTGKMITKSTVPVLVYHV
ncbi:universal stress protein [Spirosoma fluminis]